MSLPKTAAKPQCAHRRAEHSTQRVGATGAALGVVKMASVRHTAVDVTEVHSTREFSTSVRPMPFAILRLPEILTGCDVKILGSPVLFVRREEDAERATRRIQIR